MSHDVLSSYVFYEILELIHCNDIKIHVHRTGCWRGADAEGAIPILLKILKPSYFLEGNLNLLELLQIPLSHVCMFYV